MVCVVFFVIYDSSFVLDSWCFVLWSLLVLNCLVYGVLRCLFVVCGSLVLVHCSLSLLCVLCYCLCVCNLFVYCLLVFVMCSLICVISSSLRIFLRVYLRIACSSLCGVSYLLCVGCGVS